MSETKEQTEASPNLTLPRLTLSNLTIEHQIAVLEQDRTAPLSAEQRGHLPAKLSGLAESIHALRAFHLMDGGSEPGVVFHPLPGAGTSATSDEIREGDSHA